MLPHRRLGWDWCGDPDRGFGADQPGGWIFSTLGFIEQNSAFSLGAGLDFASADRHRLIAQRMATPLGVYNCPSRRRGGPFENSYGYGYRETGAVVTPLMARSDYAACVGDQFTVEINGGPSPYAQAEAVSYNWFPGEHAFLNTLAPTAATRMTSDLLPPDALQLLTPDGKGGQTEWSIEAGAPGMLLRTGWKRNSVKPGDSVTVVTHPAKSGAPTGSLVSVTTSDGRTLGPGGGAPAPTKN